MASGIEEFVKQNPFATAIIAFLLIACLWLLYQQQKSTFYTLEKPLPQPPVDIPIDKNRNKPVSPNMIPIYEANPMTQYADKLRQEGKMGSPIGTALNIEEQRQTLAQKQGVLDQSMVSRHKEYSDAMIGSWAMPQQTEIESREITAPYHGLTRALRGIKIRETESVIPDKQSQTITPLMPANALNLANVDNIDPKKINY